VDEDGIAGLQGEHLALERLLEVANSDLVVIWQHVDALERRDVDEDAARDERSDCLDPHLREPAARRDLVELEAVIDS
jgi:hypothetical protein